MTFTDVEQARAAYQKKFQKSWLIALAVVAASALLGFIFMPLAGDFSLFAVAFFAVFALIVATVVVALITRKESAAYRKAYKAYFVAGSLEKAFTNLRYDHQKGLDKNLLKSTGMINTGDAFSSNDLTIAQYKSVKFIQADATIQEEHTDSDGNTTYVTIFRGRFMIYEFPKKFDFKLELVGKKFHAYRVPGKSPKSGRKMQKMKTESTDFNRNFRIFGEDGFESFYLLDPAMIDRIDKIAARYDYKLLLGFLENTLLIALNDGKDSFEPPRFTKPLDEAAEMSKISSDIKVVTDFVDELLLRNSH